MFGLLVGAVLVTTSVSHAGIILSDSAVFSTNSSGENWNGWIWNTQPRSVEHVLLEFTGSTKSGIHQFSQ